MAGIGSLSIEFGANVATLKSDLAQAESMVAKAVGDINVTINKIGGQKLTGVTDSVNGLIGDFNRLKNVVAGVFGVNLGLGAVKSVAALADEYQNVSNRIRTTVADATQLAAIQERVFNIAQETGASLDDTAKSYQRLEQAISASGKSQAQAQQEALALTKTLNQEIVLSGASAGEASRAILDLVHGLSGGVLHAQQLRPIMRQMPDLAHQIAEGLGLSGAQFEAMVHKGLAAEDVLKALAKQSESINARFVQMPLTFARAWQELHNAVEQYIGQASQASAVSNLLKNAIVGIANHIDAIATGATAVAFAMSLWLGGKAATALGNTALMLRDMVLQQGAYKASIVLTAEAEVAAAQSQVASYNAIIVKTDALNDLRAIELASIKEKEAALVSEIPVLEKEALAGNDVVIATERLAVARQELVVVTGRIIELEGLMSAAQSKATIAEAGEAAATQRLTAAKLELAGAQTAAASAMGALSRAGSAVFSFLGGWPGLALAAAYATYQWVTSTTDLSGVMNELSAASKLQETQTVSLQDAIQGLISGNIAQVKSLDDRVEAQRKVAQAEIESLKAEQQSTISLGALTSSGGLATTMWALYEGKIYLAKKAIEDLDRAQAALNFDKFTAKIAGAVQTMQRMFGLFDQSKVQAPDLGDLEDKVNKEEKAMAKLVATFGQGKAAAVAFDREQAIAAKTAGLTGQAYEDQVRKIYDLYQGLLDQAQAEDALTAAKKNATTARKAAAHEQTLEEAAAKRLEGDLRDLTNVEDQLADNLGGPYLAALKTYQREMKIGDDVLKDAKEAKKEDAALTARVTQFQADLAEQLARTNAQIKAQNDIMSQSKQDLKNFAIVMSAATNSQEALAAGLAEYDSRMKSHIDFEGNAIRSEQKLKEALDSQLPSYIANKQALHDMQIEFDNQKKVAQDWANIWVNAGNSVVDIFAKTLVEGGDLLQGLADLAKQIVEQIISYFAKLAIINPILNSIFGNTAGWQQLAQLGGSSGGGGGGIGNVISQLFSGAAGAGQQNSGWTVANIAAMAAGESGGGGSGTSYTSLAGAAYDLFGGSGSGSPAYSAGTTMWDGFKNGIGTIWNGSGNYSSNMFGTGSASGYAPSTLGNIVGIAGGLYAGYNRYQQAGGGFAGAVGGAAYGLGTITAAGALGGIATGAGAAAGAAGGLSAVGLGAIPVVGWIALAAMLIDKFSGGKLFGTKGEVKSGVSTLSVGPGGADYSTFLALKGQSALFGGAKWSTQNVPQTPEEAEAAKKFYDSMIKTMDQYAKVYGVKAGDLVSASFGQQFDKHGNPTGITHATIGNNQYDNITEEQFSAGYVAANQLQVLSQFDAKLNETVEQYKKNIDDMISIAAGLSVAQGFFQEGGEFLAITGEQTLSAVVNLATGMQQAGEAIGDTIARLVQAQAAYSQFVDQFKPAGTYVDSYEEALSNINKQMNANIKQANALAIAAGAEGASEKDLANIHKYAAAAAAQALLDLKASAQSLAFSLGLTTQGTLDQVNQEIATLQGKLQSSQGPINGVGNAIADMAAKAKAAMDLLLGDLSPLNDQQKLQTALAGLRAGTVTQEQVLEIGRRLYASSQAYVDLFNTVKALGRGGINAGAGTGGGGGGQGGGITGAERERLTALLAEQQKLQTAQDYQNAQTLAKQIAEIALSQGIDFHDVIDNMGINLGELEQRLGINDDQFADLIKTTQEQKDSDGQNADSIIDAINAMSDAIVTVLGGTPSGHSDHGAPGSLPSQAPNTPAGHSGHGFNGREIGREIAAGFTAAMDQRDRRSARR